MKKIIAAIFAAALLLTGCGQVDEKAVNDTLYVTLNEGRSGGIYRRYYVCVLYG